MFYENIKNTEKNALIRFCLSSIRAKANCIATFWTRRPHLLGICYFRAVWATCLPYKSGGVSLIASSNDTTSELGGLFLTTSKRQAGKLWIPFFEVFWYDSERGLNPRSTDCKAGSLTTTPSRRK